MKTYTTPTIEAVGTVRGLTQQGGGANNVDVAYGTPIDVNNPDSFTGFTGS